jgi:hypothetical protein
MLSWSFICNFMHAPACLQNSAARHLRTYTSDALAYFRRRGGRRGSLSETRCRPARLLPLRWGSRAAYGRARRPLPPQVGVLGGVRPSAPAATPSAGSILSGTFLKPFQRSHLGIYPKFLQRSQQLVWWKLPSSSCI